MSTLKVDTISEKTASGGITFSDDITATLSSSSNVKAPLNASGDAPVYACRAWVNFDGTAAMTIGSSYGPDAPPADYSTPNPIRASGNVSSITDNGTGDYTVNFTTAMPDADYSVAASSQGSPSYSPQGFSAFYARTPNSQQSPATTNFRVSNMRLSDGLPLDNAYCLIQIFR